MNNVIIPEDGFFPVNIDDMKYTVEVDDGKFAEERFIKEAERDIRKDLMQCRSHTSTLEHCEMKKKLISSSEIRYVRFKEATPEKIHLLIERWKTQGLYPVIGPGNWVAGNRGQNRWYQFYVSEDKNLVENLITSIDPKIWQAMKNISIWKQIDRVGLILGEAEPIKTPNDRPLKVAVMDHDMEGEGFVTEEIAELNGWGYKTKASRVTKAVLFQESHICMNHDADIVIGQDDNKLDLDEDTLGRNFCWKPTIYPKDQRMKRPTLGIDQLIIQDEREVPELDDIKDDLAAESIPFERACEILSYVDEEGNRQVPVAHRPIFLGAPINNGMRNIILKAFSTIIRRRFRRQVTGKTGTLVDIKRIPRWVAEKEMGLLMYPDIALIKGTCKTYKNMIGVDSDLIAKRMRDKDGDIASAIELDEIGFVIDPEVHELTEPEEIKNKDPETKQEAWAKIIASHGQIGAIHNQNMILISAARACNKTDDEIAALCTEAREINESIIKNFKGNVNDAIPAMKARAKKWNIPMSVIDRETKYSRIFRNSRIDTIVTLANKMRPKEDRGWFEWATAQFKGWHITKKKIRIDRIKSKTPDNKLTKNELGLRDLERLRCKSFVELKKHLIKKFNIKDKSWLRYPDFGKFGLTQSNDPAMKEVNLQHNLNIRWKWAKKRLKNKKQAEQFIMLCLLKREYEFSNFLWERWWKYQKKDRYQSLVNQLTNLIKTKCSLAKKLGT